MLSIRNVFATFTPKAFYRKTVSLWPYHDTKDGVFGRSKGVVNQLYFRLKTVRTENVPYEHGVIDRRRFLLNSLSFGLSVDILMLVIVMIKFDHFFTCLLKTNYCMIVTRSVACVITSLNWNVSMLQPDLNENQAALTEHPSRDSIRRTARIKLPLFTSPVSVFFFMQSLHYFYIKRSPDTWHIPKILLCVCFVFQFMETVRTVVWRWWQVTVKQTTKITKEETVVLILFLHYILRIWHMKFKVQLHQFIIFLLLFLLPAYKN